MFASHLFFARKSVLYARRFLFLYEAPLLANYYWTCLFVVSCGHLWNQGLSLVVLAVPPGLGRSTSQVVSLLSLWIASAYLGLLLWYNHAVLCVSHILYCFHLVCVLPLFNHFQFVLHYPLLQSFVSTQEVWNELTFFGITQIVWLADGRLGRKIVGFCELRFCESMNYRVLL